MTIQLFPSGACTTQQWQSSSTILILMHLSVLLMNKHSPVKGLPKAADIRFKTNIIMLEHMVDLSE